ncbi:hypothetical protein [Planotetraspora kaengkrachanensis]|uniref:Lipoprotein n=1 Tax=Planotetraspora kaengkrachanensis TaxID=575193 RepID=A0A8J3M303_9ACTN|nr:hypothetical protein [Planotetraspora kaengkrachanensis]GIG78111.1 lipoprotein [Planotetraspora kaengkrachanensis]
MSRTRLHRRSLLAAASGALALGLLTGCGGTDTAAPATATTPATAAASPAASPTSTGLAALSGAEVIKQAHEASTSAKSVHLRGAFSDDDGTYELDTTMVRGKGGAGRITLDGQSVELTVIGKSAYMKGDKAFWAAAAGADAASMLAGKYVKMPSTEKGFGDLAALVEFDKMYGEMFSDTGDVKVTEPTEINGVPAITLHADDGSKIYVATEGKPYILRVSSPDDDSQYLDFLDYDKAVTLKTPPAGKVLDIGKMMG